jgi:pimeloyl-ACP methyl ester carboxylesterase
MKNIDPRQFLAYTVAASLFALSACGGGGDGTASGQISGAVIDGYIEGAKVCLDVNGNGACDATEPSGTTNAKGAYTLNASGISVDGLNIVAEIPDTAKDSDDAGLTLAAAGKTAYTMATPADKPTVVTPLTTLIVGKAKTDTITVAQASSQVLEQLGLPDDTNPHEDHISKGNSLVQAAARQVAGKLQQLQANLGAGVSASERWSKLQQARATDEKEAGTVSKTSSTALNMPASLASVATGQLFAYKMTGAKGQKINATAMLFMPKTSAPAAGWPLVVFGHGTTGVGQQCAPSVTMNSTGSWDYAGLVAMLVSQGVAVVAPDYEGLGDSTMGVTQGHPYLDLRSAGQSMVLAAVAAKKIMTTKLSGQWAAIGHSQGGQAALAAAQFSGYATRLESGLTYKGTVAIAPASNLLDSVNTMWTSVSASVPNSYQAAYESVGILGMYTAYLVQGTQSTYNPVLASSLMGSRLLGIYNSDVTSKCLDGFITAISADIGQYAATTNALPKNYPGVINAAVNAPKIVAMLATNEPGQVKLPGKTLIVQGRYDVTVLPEITNKLLTTMQSKGSEVTLSLHEDKSATHGGVLFVPAAITAVTQHLGVLFGSGGKAPPVQARTVTGTAATGNAISLGLLELKCLNATNLVSTQTDANGSFSIAVSQGNLPCLMRVTDSTKSTVLHGIAYGDDTNVHANVTPITDLVVSAVAKQNARSYFNFVSNNLSSHDKAAIETGIATVTLGIKKLVDIGSINPVTQKFTIGDSFDKKLDDFSSSLQSANIYLSDLHTVVASQLPVGTTQAEYLSNYIDQKVNLKLDLHNDFWKGFYKWVPGSYLDSNSTAPVFEYVKNTTINDKVVIKRYVIQSGNWRVVNEQNFTYSPNNLYRSASGWKSIPGNKDLVFQNAAFSIDAKGTALTTKADDGTALGRILVKELLAEDLSGRKTAEKFNIGYTNNVDGYFKEGSKGYSATLEFLDPFLIKTDSPIIVGKFTKLSDFRGRYASQPFCTDMSGRNGRYGVQFNSIDSSVTFRELDVSCNMAISSAVILANWEETTVDGLPALRVFGSKLPPRYTDFGQIMGGYDATALNENLRYATDKYEIYLFLGADGGITYGYKILAGASTRFEPGNGPYLNRNGIDSLLSLVRYPATVD